MKRNIIFIMVLTLSSNMLVANSNIHQLLGITSKKQTEQKKVVLDKKKGYIAPQKSISKDSQMDRLLKYTKIKRSSQKETAYGLKVGYKISKNISVSVDVMAQVDKEKSYKIKSKEANLQFALAL